MKSWEDQPNAQDLAIYLVGFLWDMRAFLWAHSSDHALTWGATDSAHMSLRRGTFWVDQPSGVDQPGLHQLESIATWRRVPQLLSRDLSWVITESFATREFSWPPFYVIAFFRTWTILNPGHVSPTSKDPSRCKPQRHLHPWGSVSMVSRRGGRSLQWKIDIRRYRVSNSNGASHHFVTFSLWKWPGAALEELKVKGGYNHLEQSKDTIDVAAQVGENILLLFWQNHSDVWQDICTKKMG